MLLIITFFPLHLKLIFPFNYLVCYVVPWETEAQIRLLWHREAPILEFIWGRSSLSQHHILQPITAHSKPLNDGKIPLYIHQTGWKMFFSRVILVPPNRFRPSAKIGDATTEHPQNYHLSRILENNEKIKNILQENAIANNNQKALSVVGKSGAAVIDTALTVTSSSSSSSAAVVMSSGLSKLVTTWIDLQNACNCYVDSDKDPNPLGSQNAPSGVRQLLERKEGT